MPNLAYKLVIRDASTVANPNGTTDAITITSVRSGTNPYIASPPSGDGYEIDPITGAIRSGSYSIQIADAVTGSNATGTIRFFTNKLEDANNQQQLLSRRAYLYTSSNDGVSFTQTYAGYISAIRLVSSALFEVGISDSRRVEQTRAIFEGSTLGTYTTRGCLTGGPVTAQWGPVIARGGWLYRVNSVAGNREVGLSFLSGYDSYAGAPTITDWRQLVREPVAREIAKRRTLIPDAPSGSGDWPFGYSNIVLHVGTTITNAAATNHVLKEGLPYNGVNDNPGYGNLTVWWDSAVAIPANQSLLYVSLYTREVSELSPLYIDAHPVDIVLAVWNEARMFWKNPADPDPAWVAQIRSLIGVNTRLALRITEPPTISKFLDDAIFGPFGLSARVDSASGALRLVDTRGRGTSTPSITITAADMANGSDLVFDLDEKTAVSAVQLTAKTFNTNYSAQAGVNSSKPTPTDGVVVGEVKATARNADMTVFSGREIKYDIPGMVHNAAGWLSNELEMLQSIAVPIYARFGRGSQAADVSIIDTSSAAALEVGDECIFSAPHYPNANYRIGESSVAGRIMQVIRRTETPAGPILRLLDVGLNQASSPAPTLVARKSPTAGTYAAQFRLNNAATMTAAFLSVEVQWSTGASTPTGDGTTFNVYGPADIPTDYVTLPTVPQGTRVWVRARSKAYERRASAWTAWTSVLLDSMTAVTGLTASPITTTSVTLSWTNTNVSLPVGVYLFQGASAPASWDEYKVTSLAAGTTTITIGERISSGLQYVAAIAYDDVTGAGPFTTRTFTATGSGGTALRPAGLAIVPGIDNASLLQGNVLALYPALGENPAIAELNTVIARAPDVSGSPGTFADIATVSADTTTYVDYLPRTGTTYWYRIRHTSPGKAASSNTPSVDGIATGVQQNIVRPDAVAPIVTVTTSESGTTATVTIGINDPQNRLVQVRFRQRTNNGAWSAWTIDSTSPYTYSATIPAEGFVEIEYEVTGYAADGVSRILASGIESFDADTIANIVSASGTFSLAGALTLGIQADTDTASFRYAYATTDWASDAAALAAATGGGSNLVDARNVTAILTGPYAVGTTVYLAIAGYTGASGGGTVSGPYRYSFLNGSRDTIPLIARARLFSISATQAVVRVAVASPIALSPNTATIAYTPTDLGITPASGQTVNPVTGDDVNEATTASYKDFTIPRPANGAVPARVTFTVTATGRVSATPSATIVPQNPIPASLIVNYEASDTEYVITWSVGSGDTATLSIDGGAYSTPPASPITVAREPYKTGADKVYTFKSVGAGGDTLTSSVTVAKQYPYVAAAAEVNITAITRKSTTTFTTTWTDSNLPAGATFTISWKIFDVGTGTGTANNVTSPYDATGNTGLTTGSVARVTITAKDSGGNVVASDTDTVTF